MYILGISCYYHDSAACLLKDGEIIAAAQEERFTRKKHDFHFPHNAIKYCLSEARVGINDINFVGFYDKPFVKFERILETYLSVAPAGIRSFIQAMPLWIHQKLWIPQLIQKELCYTGEIIFTEHHESHAASAFFPSPFEDAAILTADGVGEWTTTSMGVGKGNKITITDEIKFPHSLGLLYSAFTYYCGFKVNSGEYKLMGAAPFGEPKYVDLIMNELIDLKEDGSFKLNMKYFGYLDDLKMTNGRFDKLFGMLPRKSETKMDQKYLDIARSAQVVTEEVMLRMTRRLYKETGLKNICLAGGVALNCVANGRIIRETPFENIFIQPAAGDAGGALGVAQFIRYQYLGNERKTDGKKDSMKASYLGPSFSNDYIKKFLENYKIPFELFENDKLASKTAQLIAEKNVIGWFQGRMEFGPRALGNRSILGDARFPEMKDTVNMKIKFREAFRPFAPSVLKEKTSEYFDIREDLESPYMLLVAPVREDKRVIPAVTHLDYSARIQTVMREDNPLYYDLINEYYKLTGVPVIINTSFNVRGEPIVCTPEEAYRCFMRTNMDFLVMGNFLLDKKEQTALKGDIDWKKEFELD
ncbi:MAG: carbamoyltransferase [Nitrospinae bacterium]|nr:carbamoyltransferase [Nitrospinota bacterium]